jgi:predicted HicB family RNase H-like nuclease
MTHEGYLATLEFDDQAGVFHGRVVNARAVLTFEGVSTDELRTAFADTIADYMDWCAERGVEPEKPYSGTLSLRITPELHRHIAEQAAKAGESVNQFITEQLEAIPREVTLATRPRSREEESELLLAKVMDNLYGKESAHGVTGSKLYSSGVSMPSSSESSIAGVVFRTGTVVASTSESSIEGVVYRTGKVSEKVKAASQRVKNVSQGAKPRKREPTGFAKR